LTGIDKVFPWFQHFSGGEAIPKHKPESQKKTFSGTICPYWPLLWSILYCGK